MKDNEIIKALECCKSTEHCGHCSYDKDHSEIAGCTSALAKDALNLINRQKAEIAKLEKVEKYADETIKAQAAEIERLEKARQKQAQFLGEERGQKYELLNKIADITKNINFAIQATNLNSDYDVGLRNGLRLALSFIDGKEPQYESCGGKDEK